MKLYGAYNCVYINTWRVWQTRVHKSSIGKKLPWGIRLSPQTSKMSESTATLSFAERWTITEIRQQLNSVLTYSPLTDVLLQRFSEVLS